MFASRAGCIPGWLGACAVLAGCTSSGRDVISIEPPRAPLTHAVERFEDGDSAPRVQLVDWKDGKIFRWMKPPQRSASNDAPSPPPRQSSIDGASDSPRQRSDEVDADAHMHPRHGAAAAATAGRGLEAFEPTDRVRIQTALHDLPPEQQAQWIAYLKTVDPQRIPALLNARRRGGSTLPESTKAGMPRDAATPVVAGAPRAAAQRAAALSDPKEADRLAATAPGARSSDRLRAAASGGEQGHAVPEAPAVRTPEPMFARRDSAQEMPSTPIEAPLPATQRERMSRREGSLPLAESAGTSPASSTGARMASIVPRDSTDAGDMGRPVVELTAALDDDASPAAPPAGPGLSDPLSDAKSSEDRPSALQPAGGPPPQERTSAGRLPLAGHSSAARSTAEPASAAGPDGRSMAGPLDGQTRGAAALHTEPPAATPVQPESFTTSRSPLNDGVDVGSPWPGRDPHSEPSLTVPVDGAPSGDDPPSEPQGGDASSTTSPGEADAQGSLRGLMDWDPTRLWSAGRKPADEPAERTATPGEAAEGGGIASRLWPAGRLPLGRAGNERQPLSPLANDPASAAAAELSPREGGLPVRTDLDATYSQETLQRLISVMEAETSRLIPGTTFAERQNYVRRHVQLRLLYLIDGQLELAQRAIPLVDAETQEFWSALFWGLSDYFNDARLPDPADRAAFVLEQLAAAERSLGKSARLELSRLTFCDEIEGFGAFRPFESNTFRPGQPVLLYVEIRNFHSAPSDRGMHRTVLRSTLDILKQGEEGTLVERTDFDAAEDLCRSPRRDYFHSYRIDVPAHLPPGPYTARLTVEDELGGKIGTATIDFVVR